MNEAHAKFAGIVGGDRFQQSVDTLRQLADAPDTEEPNKDTGQ